LELAIVHSDHLKQLLVRRSEHLVSYIKARIASKLHEGVVTLHRKYVSGMKVLDSPALSIEGIAVLRETIGTVQAESDFLKNELFSFRKFFAFCESEQIRLSDEVVSVYFGIFHEPVTLLRTALLKRKYCEDSTSHAVSYIIANISDGIGSWSGVFDNLCSSLIRGNKSKFDRDADIDGDEIGGGGKYFFCWIVF
jgi:hypothetical protein